MHFSWLGGTSMRLQTKPSDKDITILIDPYKPKEGLFARSLAPNIALFTRGEDGAITLSGNPFVLSTAGECDVQGVLIHAVEGHEPGTTMLRIDAEGISIGHLGRTKIPPTERQLEVLGGVDILCIPVGGTDSGYYYPHEAVKIINDMEPRVVFPIGYASDNEPNAKQVETFLKEMGVSAKPEAKVILKKKDLPTEETLVMVLSKE